MRRLEIHEKEGLLRPTESTALRPGERDHQIVVRRPDLHRWNLGRLVPRAAGEDLAWAEQGLADWVSALDEYAHGW